MYTSVHLKHDWQDSQGQTLRPGAGAHQFSQFEASFQGENDTHTIHYDHGAWSCDCHFFADHGTCSHIMAAERVLGASTHAHHAAESAASDQLAAH